TAARPRGVAPGVGVNADGVGVLGKASLVHLAQVQTVVNCDVTCDARRRKPGADHDNIPLRVCALDDLVCPGQQAHILSTVQGCAVPFPAEVRLVPDFDGVYLALVAQHDVLDELAVLGEVNGRPFFLLGGPCPGWRGVDA